MAAPCPPRPRAAAAAHPEPAPEHRPAHELREEDHHADEGGHQGSHQDVSVLDVGELVGQDALQLHAVRELEQALRHGHRRVLRAAAGGEGVRRLLREHVQGGLGHARGDAQPLDDVVVLGVLLAGRGTRPADAKHQPVAVPVGGPGHGTRDHEGDDDPADPELEQEPEDVAEAGGDRQHQQHEQDRPAPVPCYLLVHGRLLTHARLEVHADRTP